MARLWADLANDQGDSLLRKSLLIAAAVAVLLAGAAAHPEYALPGLAKSKATKAGEVRCRHVTADAFRGFSERVWRLPAWERGAPPDYVIRAQRGKLRCAVNRKARAKMRDRWRADKRAYNEHRESKYQQRRERRALTPYVCGSHGRFALPCAIVECESGYDIRARNAESTAGGYGQAIDSTWFAYGGRDWGGSHPAAEAPKAEQDRVFAAIWDGGSGASHWDASRDCWG